VGVREEGLLFASWGFLRLKRSVVEDDIEDLIVAFLNS
jgi:hypothetical protein